MWLRLALVLFFVNIVTPLALGQKAPDPARLRALLDDGKAQAVRDSVVSFVRHGKEKPSLELLLIGAEAALQVGDLSTARAFADQGEAMDETAPGPHTFNGHALWAMAERSLQRGGGGLVGATLSDAAWHYAQARKLGGDAYENGFWEAEVQLLRGRHDEALSAVEAALAARKDDEAGLRLRARILLESGRAAEAVPLFERLSKASAEDEGGALLLLRAVMLAGDRRRARTLYLDLASRFPESQELHGSFFRQYEKDSPPTFLRETLNALTDSQAKLALPWWYRGWLEETAARDLEAALQAYLRYRDLVGGSSTGHWHVGRLLVGLGRLEEAEKTLLKSHALGGLESKDLAPTMAALVAAYVARKDFGRAAALQPLVLALDPTPDQQLNLGVLEYNAGRRDRGIAIYRQLVERDDVDPTTASTAWNYLALALWGTGQKTPAREAFRKSLEENEGNLDARENLGILLLELGENESAAATLRQVLEAAPERHRTRYHLMRALHSGLVGAAEGAR